MDNLFYLFLAYALIWVLIFLYIWRLGLRQTKAEKELELLKRVLNKKNETKQGTH